MIEWGRSYFSKLAETMSSSPHALECDSGTLPIERCGLWFLSSNPGILVFYCCLLYQYSKLNGLKQHKYIILQFWRSEFQNGSSEAKVKVLRGCISSGGSRGSLKQSFPASRGFQPLPWLLASITLSSASASHFLLWLWPFCLLVYKDTCDYTGPTQIIQDNLLISRSLT